MLDLGGSFKIIGFKPLIVVVRKATQSGETGAGLALRDRVVVGGCLGWGGGDGGGPGLISHDCQCSGLETRKRKEEPHTVLAVIPGLSQRCRGVNGCVTSQNLIRSQ